MITTRIKNERRERRHKRIRTCVFGTKEIPRFSVFKSNRYITAQLINDDEGKTLAFADSKASKAKTPEDRAKEVGSTIAKLAKEQKISKAVFDRGGFIFTGNIRALAIAAREGGLKF